jgi:hypothetical protein
MYKLLVALVLISINKPSFSQTYSYDSIFNRADSIMIAKVGSQVFKNNYYRDSIIRYTYKKKSNRFYYGKLQNGQTSRGKLTHAEIIYVFSLNVANSFTPTLTYVKFDSSITLENTPNTEFIPPCILENNSCNIISKQKAIEIAKSNFKEKMTLPISAHFGYLASSNKYTWAVINDLGDDVSRGYHNKRIDW